MSALVEAPVCPICRSIYVRPRIYPECGHSLCENCHVQTDQHTDVPDAYTAIVYKCPICRSETLTPWARRPLNRTLDNICASSFADEYKERADELGDAPAPEKIVDKQDVDLAKLAIAERDRVATALYEEIFPLLHKAARDGGDFISITSKAKVRAIYRVADQLTTMLFRHKIYRMVCTPEEVTIHILKRGEHSRNEFLNMNYEAPMVTSLSTETTIESLSNISTTIQNLVNPPSSPRLTLAQLRLPLRRRRHNS